MLSSYRVRLSSVGARVPVEGVTWNISLEKIKVVVFSDRRREKIDIVIECRLRN